jgi:hypothetical protein
VCAVRQVCQQQRLVWLWDASWLRCLLQGMVMHWLGVWCWLVCCAWVDWFFNFHWRRIFGFGWCWSLLLTLRANTSTVCSITANTTTRTSSRQRWRSTRERKALTRSGPSSQAWANVKFLSLFFSRFCLFFWELRLYCISLFAWIVSNFLDKRGPSRQFCKVGRLLKMEADGTLRFLQ